MIIARSSVAARYSIDPVAENVRGFVASSDRLEFRSESAPSAAAELDLVGLYPSIFRETPKASVVGRSVRAMSRAQAGVAAVVAALAGIIHR
jgi:hypothetical protein